MQSSLFATHPWPEAGTSYNYPIPIQPSQCTSTHIFDSGTFMGHTMTTPSSPPFSHSPPSYSTTEMNNTTTTTQFTPPALTPTGSSIDTPVYDGHVTFPEIAGDGPSTSQFGDHLHSCQEGLGWMPSEQLQVDQYNAHLLWAAPAKATLQQAPVPAPCHFGPAVGALHAPSSYGTGAGSFVNPQRADATVHVSQMAAALHAHPVQHQHHSHPRPQMHQHANVRSHPYQRPQPHPSAHAHPRSHSHLSQAQRGQSHFHNAQTALLQQPHQQQHQQQMQSTTTISITTTTTSMYAPQELTHMTSYGSQIAHAPPPEALHAHGTFTAQLHDPAFPAVSAPAPSAAAYPAHAAPDASSSSVHLYQPIPQHSLPEWVRLPSPSVEELFPPEALDAFEKQRLQQGFSESVPAGVVRGTSLDPGCSIEEVATEVPIEEDEDADAEYDTDDEYVGSEDDGDSMKSGPYEDGGDGAFMDNEVEEGNAYSIDHIAHGALHACSEYIAGSALRFPSFYDSQSAEPASSSSGTLPASALLCQPISESVRDQFRTALPPPGPAEQVPSHMQMDGLAGAGNYWDPVTYGLGWGR